MRRRRVARTDRQAFELVLGRLEGDVGGLLQLWRVAHTQGDPLTPFWAFARMLFPIAEAIGDLIYQDRSTVVNLTSVLEKECESVRPGYKGKANILPLMYRHSLTHTDEARSLRSRRKIVDWALSLDEQEEHLKVQKPGRGRRIIRFDLTAFYEDLRQVCTNAREGKWGRRVVRRYNEWLLLDLNRGAMGKPSHNKTAAKAEIVKL